MSDRIAVMHEGRLLQVGTPEDIYQRPANRFVADFIGRTNLLEGTVASATEVMLSNGMRVAAASDHAVGTKVAVSLRPEQALLSPRGGSPAGWPSLDGVLRESTYVGNALVHSVAVDWITIEVRTPYRSTEKPMQVGDEVSVSWEPDGVTVVA